MKTLAFFFALVSPLFARLGESLEECKARYGEPYEVLQESSTACFNKAGLTVIIQFDKGRAAGIVFHKKKEAGETVIAPLSDTELVALLASNSGGATWVEREDLDLVKKIYDTKDESRLAIYDKIQHRLSFFTMAYLNMIEAKKEAEEAKNLNGF